MAEQPETGGDRTEAATPRRLQRAREAGEVAVSRELPVFAVLGAVALVLAWQAPDTARDVAVRLGTLIGRAADDGASPAAALRAASFAGLRAAAPPVLAALAAGIGAVLIQTGFLLRWSAVKPNLARLSPAAGLRRLFGLDGLVEAGKSFAKLAAIGFAVWRTLATDLPALALAPFRDPRQLPAALLQAMLHLVLTVLAVQAAITVLDLAWVRFRHGQTMRMSRQDIREEQRETEGDPKVKLRLRQLRMQRARRRMLAAVPKAAVVITNPTHYAVALVYDRERNAAPRVVAKGVEFDGRADP